MINLEPTIEVQRAEVLSTQRGTNGRGVAIMKTTSEDRDLDSCLHGDEAAP